MELQVSLPCSQESATGSHFETNEVSTPHTQLLEYIFYHHLSGQGDVPGSSCYWEVTLVVPGGLYSPGVVDTDYSLFPPKTICAWWTATSYGRWPCCAEHSGSKGV